MSKSAQLPPTKQPTKNPRPRMLAARSRGLGGRAAAILLAAHAAAAVPAWVLWAVGLAPMFDDARWIPIAAVSVTALVIVVVMFARYGFWATAAGPTTNFGEDYEKTFTEMTGLGLGWLRWLLQLILCGALLAAVGFTAVDVRWWNLVGTPEIRALPDRVAALPIPADWHLDHAEHGSASSNKDPNMRYDLVYDVPAGYTFADLKHWLAGPDWTANPDGADFGAISIEDCSDELSICHAHLNPQDGREPEYTIYANLASATGGGPGSTRVYLHLSYRKQTPVTWDVDASVIARAQQLPVPEDWVKAETVARDDDTGQELETTYGVPASFTVEDLQAWLEGSAWTKPTTGEAFGAIEYLYECQDSSMSTVRCTSGVSATAYTDSYGIDRFGDFVEVTFRPELHTVRVGFRRTEPV